MLSSLLGPDRRPSSFRRFLTSQSPKSNNRDQNRPWCDDRENDSGSQGENAAEEYLDNEDVESDEDGEVDAQCTPLLPIFSAAHLDALPVYDLTHSIRTLIEQRCETTLSWDQLRAPQISQFLVKPIQVHIRSAHFSRAILYVLLANCLQFNKEGQANPGNVGVLRTRSHLSELLAIRLLKEFSARELIDSLSYDFDPLQGLEPSRTISQHLLKISKSSTGAHRIQAARTSAFEVAIRAEAKRFLAHPLVVEHLEAIWAGSIVFHSAADSLHRMPTKPMPTQKRQYGAAHSALNGFSHRRNSNSALTPPHGHAHYPPGTGSTVDCPGQMVRRSVSLYNPHDSSICKLSRLRVPKYRQMFSTISYALMLSLFLAVLVQRSLFITPLEIVFWLWSAGFMLDEILGFSEQGFSLYIMSVWNAFDIGILLLFLIYYLLRIYGILIAEDQRLFVADMAYDTLASTAVLLFPRLFSLLDHYRYFSQLLIAFRLMAQDLAAVLILIGITCSGFFVAFALSFGRGAYDGAAVAYGLFQILMGFTPAAWQVWPEYNILGKFILTLFLIICHFLVVTMLITVLTNSFMRIVKNADEEHQFLFAVNVLSMVKSDALFSYIAPSNLIGWIISPLRYIIPFRQFVRINRSVIKLTHFPILLLIFLYEKIWLSYLSWELTDLNGLYGWNSNKFSQMPGFGSRNNQAVFAQSVRLREPSATTRYKDRALEEVFRQPYRGDTLRRTPNHNINRSSSAVDLWMNSLADSPSPPENLARPGIVDNSEAFRPPLQRSATSLEISPRKRAALRSMPSMKNDTSNPMGREIKAIGADWADDTESEDQLLARNPRRDSPSMTNDHNNADRFPSELNDTTLRRNVYRDTDSQSLCSKSSTAEQSSEYGLGTQSSLDGATGVPRLDSQPDSPNRHRRQTSANTIVFNPIHEDAWASPMRQHPTKQSRALNKPGGDLLKKSFMRPVVVQHSSKHAGRKKKANADANSNSKAKGKLKWPLNTNTLSGHARNRTETSYDALALDLASDIGDNRHIGMDGDIQAYRNLVPGSFSTQIDIAAAIHRGRRHEHQHADETNLMSRLMLARMNLLEQGFQDILREMREWRNASSHGTSEGGSAAEFQSYPDQQTPMKPNIANSESTAVHNSSSASYSYAKDEGRSDSGRETVPKNPSGV